MSREAADRSAKVTVTTSSTLIAARNMGRASVTITNTGANPVYLTFETSRGTDPTASTAAAGAYLAPKGSAVSDFLGAIAGIATGGSSDVTVMEY